ncbi:carboxypeptidase-like regulatory domain-containing protein [Leeuwenhoekiella palythoae]|uniref:carboxypeptidase-like regulatory domain-containing protein n=1 Tax=Leeuwenhoekiella palythoae TaxID=573501 RepID=UPI0035178834
MYFKLRIPEPCHEDWSQMTLSEQGRFCSSCEKEVIDFTQLTRKQIADKVQSGGQLCGRYRKDQLDTTYFIPEEKSPFKHLGIAAAFTSLLALCEPVLGQEQSIAVKHQSINNDSLEASPNLSNQDPVLFTGQIFDSSSLSLPGVYVRLEGTSLAVRTDFDGFFKLNVPLEIYQEDLVVVCSFVGFENLRLSLKELKKRQKFKLEMGEMLSGEVVIVRTLNSRTKKPRSKRQ